jgi:hypothetical protein
VVSRPPTWIPPGSFDNSLPRHEAERQRNFDAATSSRTVEPPMRPPPVQPPTGWMNAKDDSANQIAQQAAVRQGGLIAANSGAAAPPFPPSPAEVAALPQVNTVEPGPEKLVVVSTGSAALETGALETGSPEIDEPTLQVNKGASRQVIERRLLERPDDIIAASRGFAEGLKRQADELRASKPNEAGPLAQYDDLIAFLDKMVSGLAELADALDQAFKTTAAAQHPSPEPIFLGTAAEIARRLHLGAMDWLEQNSTTVFNVPWRISVFCAGIAFLHWIGADSFTAIGTLGYLVRSKEDKKRRQEKKPLGKK